MDGRGTRDQSASCHFGFRGQVEISRSRVIRAWGALLALTLLIAVGCDDGAADDGMLQTTAAVSGTAPTDLQDLILSDGVVTTA